MSIERYFQDEASKAIPLIRAISAYVSQNIKSGDQRKVFLSGNSAALININRTLQNHEENSTKCNRWLNSYPPDVTLTDKCPFLKKYSVNPDLIEIMEKEISLFISFGVKDESILDQLEEKLQPNTEIDDSFKVVKANLHKKKKESVDLSIDAFEIEVNKTGMADSHIVKFYGAATFKYPKFGFIQKTSFDTIELKAYLRALPIEGEHSIYFMSLHDIVLLKYFSTLAPVYDKIKTHNSYILDTLFNLIKSCEKRAYFRGGFDTLKSFIEPIKEHNERIAFCNKLGIPAPAIESMEKGYDFAGILLSSKSKIRNVYHNIWHTDAVLGNAFKFVDDYFPDFPYVEELAQAAIFHDCNLGIANDELYKCLKEIFERSKIVLTKKELNRFTKDKLANQSNESIAAEVADLYLTKIEGWGKNRISRVKKFIIYTQLGKQLQVPDNTDSDDYQLSLGKALLQTSDIYQTMLGNFYLFLINNRHLLFELRVDADRWYQCNLDMFEQLWESVVNGRFDNPQFNVNILQFEFEGRDKLIENLKKGITYNRDRWMDEGLSKCREWSKEFMSPC